MWCSHAGFMPCVKEVCNQPDSRFQLCHLAAKLKKTKVALRSWNIHTFGRVDQSIKNLEQKLDFWEHQLQVKYNSKIEEQVLATKMKLSEWEKREEIQLAQKAKKKWLQEGDQNTKFFHATVN
ncbi:hypothetical protein I3760_04G119700 [Carya illinoinensis]|nr:hypothetical protein I3760_04G119700 [Carya illinoinensis]